MAAWLSVYPRDQLHVVQYERLAADPEAEVLSLIRHVGAPEARHSHDMWSRLSKVVRQLDKSDDDKSNGVRLLRTDTKALLDDFFRPYNHVRNPPR